MSGQQTRDYIVRGADGSVKIVHQERVNHRNTANNLTAYAGRRKIQNNLKKAALFVLERAALQYKRTEIRAFSAVTLL